MLLVAGIGLVMYFADSFTGAEKTAAIPGKTTADPEPIAIDSAQASPVAPIETRDTPDIFATASLNTDNRQRVPFSKPVVVGPDGELVMLVATEPEPVAAKISTPSEPGNQSDSIRFVTAKRVNVRKGPSTDTEVLDQVIFAEAVEVLSEPADGWVLIRIEGDGVEGYIASRFLQRVDPLG